MGVFIEPISGVMLGVEVVRDDDWHIVVDFFVLRVVIVFF